MTTDYSKIIPLSLEQVVEDSGTVRTDLLPTVGQAKARGFSVDFEIVYEVHGGFDPGDKDNASLMGIKIIPFPKDHERQFKSFEVKLSVLAPQQNSTSSTTDDDPPQLISFEPASQGSQFVDVHTTNEARERTNEISCELPIYDSASLGAKRSSTKKSEFTKTHLLRVHGWAERDPPTLPSASSFRNRAAWRITPAVSHQGIGDCFSVSLLIKRPPGSKFCLTAAVDGDVGSFVANSKELVSLGVRGKRSPTFLGNFPSGAPQKGIVPPDVKAENLHRVSTDGLMSQFSDIGLHLPQLAKPMKFDKKAISATSLELSSTNKVSCDEERPDDTSVAASYQSQITNILPPGSAAMHADRKNVDELETTIRYKAAAETSQPTQPDAVRLTEMTTGDLLSNLLQRLQEMSIQPSRPHPNFSRNDKGSVQRVKRHREMARLYEQLAELHREEAEEFLPISEK